MIKKNIIKIINYFSNCFPTPRYIRNAEITAKIIPISPITILKVEIFSMFDMKMPYMNTIKHENP